MRPMTNLKSRLSGACRPSLPRQGHREGNFGQVAVKCPDLVWALMRLLQHAHSHQRLGAQGRATRPKLQCGAGAVGYHLQGHCRDSEVATGCCTCSQNQPGSRAQYLGASWGVQGLQHLEEGGHARIHCMLGRHMQQRAAMLVPRCRAGTAQLGCLRLGLMCWQLQWHAHSTGLQRGSWHAAESEAAEAPPRRVFEGQADRVLTMGGRGSYL